MVRIVWYSFPDRTSKGWAGTSYGLFSIPVSPVVMSHRRWPIAFSCTLSSYVHWKAVYSTETGLAFLSELDERIGVFLFYIYPVHQYQLRNSNLKVCGGDSLKPECFNYIKSISCPTRYEKVNIYFGGTAGLHKPGVSGVPPDLVLPLDLFAHHCRRSGTPKVL